MLSRLYGVLLPFFVSFLLAWLLDPLVNFIQHKCRVKFRGMSEQIEAAKSVAEPLKTPRPRKRSR